MWLLPNWLFLGRGKCFFAKDEEDDFLALEFEVFLEEEGFRLVGERDFSTA
jgi:hypothetical protein